MKQILFIVSVITLCSSCRKSCTTPVINAILVSRSHTYPDTSVTLSNYTKSGTFATIITSYNYPLDTSYAIYSGVLFPQGIDPYDYDWQLVMHPSGTTFKITGIAHDNSYENRPFFAFGENKGCVNKVFYTVNGSATSTRPELDNNGGSSALINVQY